MFPALRETDFSFKIVRSTTGNALVPVGASSLRDMKRIKFKSLHVMPAQRLHLQHENVSIYLFKFL